MSLSECVKGEKSCVWWADKYFGLCLCNLNDDLSLGLGLISMILWGVAQIPQIISNFRTKSTNGLSLPFLLTWTIGDVFNLVGCLQEPAILPTQLFTALLYTASTAVLVLQVVYYDHISPWWNCRRINPNLLVKDEERPRKPKSVDSRISKPSCSLKVGSTPPRYYSTAIRRMAGSSSPPFGAHLRIGGSCPSAVECYGDFESEDEKTQLLPNNSVSKPKPLPRSTSYGTFLAASVNLPRQTKAKMELYAGNSGRGLLHEHVRENNVSGGQLWGWLMAAVYIGTPIPQIWLNMKRGTVEGLSPSMFILALLANATYIGSILVRTTEWEKLKGNMPWLLDAGVCMLLDSVIMLQYLYYKYRQRRLPNAGEDMGDYIAANKEILP